MKKTFKVTIKNKETGREYQEEVNNEEYILHQFEKKGLKLPFSCRNGCCTSCAVKIISGKLKQPEAMGVSQALKEKGYALTMMKFMNYNLANILERVIQELHLLGNLKKIKRNV